jgi:hypothetical protein
MHDYWLVIFRWSGKSRRAEKRVKQTRFTIDTTLIESTSQIRTYPGDVKLLVQKPRFARCTIYEIYYLSRLYFIFDIYARAAYAEPTWKQLYRPTPQRNRFSSTTVADWIVIMTISAEQFQAICNGVWRDRAVLLKGRGFLSGEAALMRAVYWRVSKAGIKPILSPEDYSFPRTAASYELGVSCLLEVHGRPRFNGSQYLKELVQHYRNELRESC